MIKYNAITLILGLMISYSAQAQDLFPKLFIDYSIGIDTFCRPREDYPTWVNQVVQNLPNYQFEMFQKLPWFQQEWNNFATQALSTLVGETGVLFQRKEYDVALYLCPTTASMGTPIQVNVLYHLQMPIKDIPDLTQPHPTFLFLAMVFHELGHKYVEQIQPPQQSKLIQTTYKNEENMTKVHLHLFALQKRVWQKLGLSQQLPYIQQRDAFFGPEYFRAWQIIEEDGEDQFIEELKAR